MLLIVDWIWLSITFFIIDSLLLEFRVRGYLLPCSIGIYFSAEKKILAHPCPPWLNPKIKNRPIIL
jgi:hypothetical protein